MPSFAPIEAAATAMRAFARPWWVAGGWAIDLFLDMLTRPHEDIEIGIARADQVALHAYLQGWTLSLPALDGRTDATAAWLAEDWLDFPKHQVFAARAGAAPTAIDFFLDDIADGVWHYRPHPAIARTQQTTPGMASIPASVLPKRRSPKTAPNRGARGASIHHMLRSSKSSMAAARKWCCHSLRCCSSTQR